MSDQVLTTLITTFGSIAVAVITVIVKSKLDKSAESKKKDAEEAITENDLEEMMEIQIWLDGFRENYEFERAGIFQFHNGGKFFKGKSMKKFSMTYESTEPGYEKIKRYNQNVLASEFPEWISIMLKKKAFALTVEELNQKDQAELRKLGVKQFVTVPIYCLQNKLIGFIVGYNISYIDEEIRKKFVSLVEDSKFVSGYLN